jgi:hypothetical protein
MDGLLERDPACQVRAPAAERPGFGTRPDAHPTGIVAEDRLVRHLIDPTPARVASRRAPGTPDDVTIIDFSTHFFVFRHGDRPHPGDRDEP